MSIDIDKYFENNAELEDPMNDLKRSKQMLQASNMMYKAKHYNWDQGYQEVYNIANHHDCDMATIIMLYWLNQPLFYLDNPKSENPIHQEGKDFKRFIEEKIKSRYYPSLIRFDTYDFVINHMDLKDDLKIKKNFLHKIPIEFFKSVQTNSEYLSYYRELPRDLNLLNVKRLYLFDFLNYDQIKNIKVPDTLEQVSIITNAYNRSKPKKVSFSALMNFKLVKILELSYCARFTDLQLLENFKNLRDLSLNTDGENYEGFANFKNLKRLKITEPILKDLSKISKFKNLEELIISCCPKITNLDGIEKLTKLKYLGLESVNKLKSIKGVSKLNLNKLTFRETCLSSKALNEIRGLQLETLQIDCKSLTNLNFLDKNSNLQNSLKSLYLYRCKLFEETKDRILKEFDYSCNIIEAKYSNAL